MPAISDFSGVDVLHVSRLRRAVVCRCDETIVGQPDYFFEKWDRDSCPVCLPCPRHRSKSGPNSLNLHIRLCHWQPDPAPITFIEGFSLGSLKGDLYKL